MQERVFGIETEYAIIFHPRRGESRRPTNYEIYRRFETALLARVRTLPHAFSPLRAKGGRFLENGGSFHYEATAQEYEHGLLELASPECRDPYTLVTYERAKDALAEELAEEVTRELELAGYRGQVRLGKNNVDSEGHTFGSHESYWVEDPLSRASKLALVPIWLLLWLVSGPVVAFVVGIQFVILLGVVISGLLALILGVLVRPFSARLSTRVFASMERISRNMEENPGEVTRRLQWLAAPLYPLMDLHSIVYNRFHFRTIRRDLTAFLITRTLYAGAGSVGFDGPPLIRLAQRPPFLRALARIFPEGEERPLYETRDLFFSPLSALRSRRRLHLLIGDANLCEWAQLLRVGTTALMLEAIESGRVDDWPQLAHPLDALSKLNRDPRLEVELDLTDGSRVSALEIQRACVERVQVALGDELGGWRRELIDYWMRTLAALERDPDELHDRIDWIAKRQDVREVVTNEADWRLLETRGAELVAPDAGGSTEDRRLRELAFQVWRADLRYHELGPRGGFRRREARGRVWRCTEEAAVRRARTEPPSDTRAWARGQAIKWAHAHATPGQAAWNRVRLAKGGRRSFRDPLDAQRDRARTDVRPLGDS
jgi:proteasome accessory factor A